MRKNKLMIALAAVIPFVLVSCASTGGGEYTNLTQCLKNNKVVMFGASWCPHCADQKALFKKSVKDIPYFECSENGKQVPECDERGIMSYPTWQFNESIIASLPQTAMLNLFNSELEKVRATVKMYRSSVKDKKPELIAVIDAYEKHNNDLVMADIPEFEKLKKLTNLVEGPDQTLIEKPVYNLGRIAGQRPLSEIALYSGCNDAYMSDTVATK